MNTETIPGRLWLKFDNCRIYPASACPLDPATANAHGFDGDPAWVPGPPCSAPARPASRAVRRGKSGTQAGGMFDGPNGGERP